MPPVRTVLALLHKKMFTVVNLMLLKNKVKGEKNEKLFKIYKLSNGNFI
jgi:hypothetical protein